jgi:hypothetical protein
MRAAHRCRPRLTRTSGEVDGDRFSGGTQMIRLTGVVTVFLMLLISAADAQTARGQDGGRNRGLERERQREVLVELGRRKVDLTVDRDVMSVNQSDERSRRRSYRALQFFVEDNDILLLGIEITYENDYKEEFPVNKVIRQGGRYTVNLDGGRSYLKQITMLYQSNNENAKGRASVIVFGERTPLPPPTFVRAWQPLGCERVKIFPGVHDAISFWLRGNRIRAIRLIAKDNDVEVLELRVHYNAGPPENFDVTYIDENQYTNQLDLRGGRDRVVDRLHIRTYSTVRPSEIVTGQKFKRPIVCVEILEEVVDPSVGLRPSGT